MATMNMGYHYDEGKGVGYDISTTGLYLSNVSYKDKGRIIREMKYWGCSDIQCTRVEN